MLFALGSRLAPQPVPLAVTSKYATSTATSFALAVIPLPPTTLNVLLAVMSPPPVKPVPAVNVTPE